MAGVQAGSAGRLSIEIVAEIARLQQDLDKAKKLVNAASGDIAKGARAANDNLASVGDGANRAARGAQRLGDDARKAGTGLDSLSGAATRLVGALAAAFSVREVGRAADAWSDMQSRIGAAIKDMDAAPAVMEEMVRLANASYSSLDQTVETFGQNVGVLKELGLSTNQALQYTEALNHALVITATKGQEAASVQNALSKAMAVGKLQADGLETVLANGGRVAEALAAELDTTINGLREMASQGKITSDVIANSLINRIDELRAAAEEMPATMEDGLLRISTNFTALVGQLDQTVGVSQEVAEALVWVADNLEPIARYAVAAGTAFVTYRAALLASAALTKTYTFATGTLGTAKLALAGSTSVATAATNAFTAAIARNPVGIFAVALASLAATYVLLRNDITGATEATLRMAEINQRATKLEGELRTAMIEVANATGDAKVKAEERAEALRKQSEETIRAARSESILAAATAMRLARQAQDRAELARASVRYNPFVEGDIGFIQQAIKARQEAEKASQEWRESMLAADGLARSIEEAAKPVQLLATNLGNTGKETKNLRDEAKKLDDTIGKLVDGNLKSLSREMAKIFNATDGIGAGIFKASDDELEKILGTMNEDFDLAYESASRFGDALEDLQHIAGQLDFGQIFGPGGRAVDEMRETVERLTAAQEAHGYAVHAAGDDQAKVAQANRAYDEARLNGTVAMLGAAKNLFKEHSTGYKAMAAAEKAFAVVQMANTAINIAAGAAKMFATLGPFGFPAVAAMVAVMAGLGAAVSGGGSSYKPLSAKEIQDAQGTGSVLGDAEAKSGSLANALDLMLKNTNKDLEYSSQMVRSLRAIESNIGALTGLLARQLNVPGGSFDQSGLGLGSKTSTGLMGFAALGAAGGLAGLILKEIPIIGDILGGIVKALFGTKKTVTLLDQGITFASQTVEDIINGGAIGQIYQDVQTQTKKKFFGVTTSNKTKVTTQYGDLDNDMERQVALIIGSLKSGILDAAGVLGIAGAEAALNAFTVNLGKISLKDLKGDEIRAALESVFSKLGDDMAAAVLPGLTAFQRVGEGVLETLARLARDYMTIDTALTSIGMTFGAVGLASVEARESLIELFGGLDAFAEQTNFFRENFLTEAEQMAPIITAVTAEMARLGQATVTGKDQFKALVLGLDLSTASGAEMYASLMAVAPAFAKVQEYLAEIGQGGPTAEQLAATAKQGRDLAIAIAELENPELARQMRLADERALIDEANLAAFDRLQALRNEAAALAEVKRVSDERYGLEARLLQLQGDTGALRQRELDALDPANRALLQLIFNLEDFKAGAEAAAAAQKAVTDEIGGLERQWLGLIGDVDKLRELQLGDLLSGDARSKQQMIWAEQDRQAAAAEAARAAEQAASAYTRAVEAYNKAIEDARNTLAQAYERESSALQQTIDKFREFSASIKEFRDGLLGPANPAFGLAQAQTTFASTSRMAGVGSEKALGAFTGDAQAYLDAATRYGTENEYKRALAAVLSGSNSAISASDGMASMAQRQLTVLDRSLVGIIDLNEHVVSVAEALSDYNDAVTAQVPTFSKVITTGLSQVTGAITNQTTQSQASDEKRTAAEVSFAGRLANIETLLERVIRGDAIQIATDGSISVSVTNTAGNPVPVDQVPA